MQEMQLCSDSNPADFIRLFVLVRTDIPYEHQAVQAGHAVIQYCLNNLLTVPFNRNCHNRNNIIDILSDTAYDDKYVGENFVWGDTLPRGRGTVIYLAVDNELELTKWYDILINWGIEAAMFTEPDWVDREVPTALASIGFKGDFNELSLMRMPKGFFANKCKSERLEIE